MKVIKKGTKGTEVKILQGMLNLHGANLSLDGSCGPATINAIKAFQKKKGLAVDGCAGPAT